MYHKQLKALLAVCCVAVCGATASAQVTVTIDTTVKYQTIEGLGAGDKTLCKGWLKREGAFLVQVDLEEEGFYDTIVGAMGLTLVRHLMDAYASPAPDSFVVTNDMRKAMNNMRLFREAAERLNEPLKYFGTLFSPPGWMKVSGEVTCVRASRPDPDTTSCRLIDGMEDELAEFCVKYLHTMKDSGGEDFFAFGIANEPQWTQPFPSVVWSDVGFANAIKVLGRRLESETGITRRLLGSDDVIFWFPNYYEKYIQENDPEALGYIYAWSVHGPPNRYVAEPGSYEGSTPTAKPCWETESHLAGDGGFDDWPEAMSQSYDIMLHRLRRNRIAAWANLDIMINSSTGNPEDYTSRWPLLVDGQYRAHAYAVRHYTRYIRPGARQIASQSSDSNSVGVVAFQHSRLNCVSLVLTNRANTDKTIDGITGTGVPAEFERITSTQDERLVKTTVSSSGALVLPAQSITTLVAGQYMGTAEGTGTVEPRFASRPSGTASTAKRPAVLYTLTGRRVNAPRAMGIVLEVHGASSNPVRVTPRVMTTRP